MKYRPDIDGLRALAVLLVVLYHADLGGVRGGFVGVDVFFVISGYLISELILRQIEKGTFSLRNFWARRILRLMPALALTLLLTLLVGCLVLLPSHFNDLGKAVVAQPILLTNVLYWRTL